MFFDYLIHQATGVLDPIATRGAALSLAVVAAWWIMMRWLRSTGYGIAVIALPGTALHELAHFLAGFFLRARPVSLSLFPRREGGTWVLGSVGFERLTLFNACFVAFAPLALVIAAWWIFMAWVQPALLSGEYLSWFVGTYVCACALFSCLPSWTDIRVGAASALFYGIGGAVLWNCLGRFHG
ncbi:hypothetical protein KDW40_19205 [Burkholderia cenocepacia]|uniref:Uncharacterized protein n=1 Tax=Burkholderia gladioli (strain BSR3) TaxID=999541 RepID=F2LSD1_BURGS|nr:MULTISPECIES: hypothetical protein [Burkholderia]AEA65727.1 hypothetical protein bgla_3p0260 [Burkholderia gladioli BSR3]MBR8327860.1 hypothetical protein [Burkholderia cenocepacia]